MPTPTFIFPSAPALSASAIYALDVFADKPVFQPESASFTRATTATRTNSSGLIEEVAAGIARVDWSGSGAPNTLLEPQRTNLAVNSIWAGGGVNPTSWNLNAGSAGTTTPTTSIKTSLATAYRFQVNNQRRYLIHPTPITSSVTYSFSIHVESVVDSLQIQNMLNCFAIGSQIFTREGVTISPADEVQAGFRYTLTGVALSTTTAEFRVGGGVGGADIADITLSMPQIEVGAYPTSFIPSTSTSVTRNADTFNVSDIYTSGKITSAGGTWFVDLRNNIDYTADTIIGAIFLDTTPAGYVEGFMFRKFASGRLIIRKLIASTATTLYTTTSNTPKVAIKWNGTTADVFENGSKVVSASAFTPTAMQFLANTNNPLYANINSMALYSTPISDADCIELTTL
jgi:hypothetical protein